jgi:hypothetical protein
VSESIGPRIESTEDPQSLRVCVEYTNKGHDTDCGGGDSKKESASEAVCDDQSIMRHRLLTMYGILSQKYRRPSLAAYSTTSGATSSSSRKTVVGLSVVPAGTTARALAACLPQGPVATAAAALSTRRRPCHAVPAGLSHSISCCRRSLLRSLLLTFHSPTVIFESTRSAFGSVFFRSLHRT